MLGRAIRSIGDGSFGVKLLNKVSRTRYVAEQAPRDSTHEFIAAHYGGEGWKSLSHKARERWVELWPVFSTCEIKRIMYVGANDGTMALAIDEAYPNREFYLVEPVPTTYEKLQATIAGHDRFHSMNAACGAEPARLEMFVDDFHQASSLLAYETKTLEEFKFLGKKTKVEVDVKPLDQILSEFGLESADLLIIDVQGYEDRVLAGARTSLKGFGAVVCELSLQTLYKESSTFDSVYQSLVRQGFRILDLFNPLKGESGQTLQIDGIFVRDGSGANGSRLAEACKKEAV